MYNTESVASHHRGCGAYCMYSMYVDDAMYYHGNRNYML